MSAKTRGSRIPKKMNLFGARAILFLVTLAFAAFTVINYGLMYWADNKYLAMFLMVVFGLSAMVTPFLTPVLVHARGVWIAAGLLILAMFMAIDGFGFSSAFKTLVVEPQNERQLAAWESANKEAITRLSDAREARDAIVMDEACATCPKTRVANLTIYQAEIEIAKTEIENAKAEIGLKPDPQDTTLITIASFVLQIVLALAFAFIESVREGKYGRDMNDHKQRYSRKKSSETNPVQREDFGGLFAIKGGKAS